MNKIWTVLIIFLLAIFIKLFYDHSNVYVNNVLDARMKELNNKMMELKKMSIGIGYDNKDYNDSKENFLDMGMLNKPVINGEYTDVSLKFKNQPWYPNMSLPAQVIGCGGRRQPCHGGTQVTIPNTFPPIDISDRNIAPNNIIPNPGFGHNRLHQVGVIQKIFGSENDVYPLYGRKDPYRRNVYEYYTVLGQLNQLVPVLTKSRNDELGTNEVVRIGGNTGKYRTIIYDSTYPRYTPYVY